MPYWTTTSIIVMKPSNYKRLSFFLLAGAPSRLTWLDGEILKQPIDFSRDLNTSLSLSFFLSFFHRLQHVYRVGLSSHQNSSHNELKVFNQLHLIKRKQYSQEESVFLSRDRGDEMSETVLLQAIPIFQSS